MTYGNIYVAKVAMGANPNQIVKAFIEAESYPGPSLIIAYTHCIAHGIDMTTGYDLQKQAVECGHWPLFRFDPRLKEQGKNPLQLDSKAPTVKWEDYAYKQTRYRALQKINPQAAEQLGRLAAKDVADKWHLMEQLAKISCGSGEKTES